ncbi:putative uridine nucleosidase 2 [Camellia lanceoleosa]|uniref:Uridine nucleosidase 2 n=1 Tax=Camellia lanceoleosa TaxID=1840588 RepID=A0ACC0ITT3_9ERIC|nr:putative uridine nucleosidase 2 [Camellia lanceoleosa]
MVVSPITSTSGDRNATNIAMAIQLDPVFAKNIGQIVVLGGAFAVNGSVNPAVETNIFGDPDAADIVFTSGADVLAVGINVTHQVVLTDTDRDKLAQSGEKFAHYMCKILDVYFSYHHDSYCMKGVYLHDPTALLAAVNPSLITYTEGQQEGLKPDAWEKILLEFFRIGKTIFMAFKFLFRKDGGGGGRGRGGGRGHGRGGGGGGHGRGGELPSDEYLEVAFLLSIVLMLGIRLMRFCVMRC